VISSLLKLVKNVHLVQDFYNKNSNFYPELLLLHWLNVVPKVFEQLVINELQIVKKKEKNELHDAKH